MDSLSGTGTTFLPGVVDDGEDPHTVFTRQLLAEACMAVARDMECYDYQIGRLIRKVSSAVVENPPWAEDQEHLLRLVRSAAAGFGGRRERVWTASFDSTVDVGPTQPCEETGQRTRRRSA